MIKRTGAFSVSAFILAAFFSATPCAAENAEIKTATDLNFVLATTMETKLKLIETITVPFFAGGGSLVADNNLQMKLGAELSPVSVNGTVETILTPIAFLQFNAGASVGSGWNIPIANGLRTNERVANPADPFKNAELTGGAFPGLVWSAKAGGAFQFDLAALKPGDWNHIVFRTYHAAQYKALTSAGRDESWLYEADSGQNRNGWNYYGNYFLGYKMPIVLNTAGFLLEADQYLYDTKDRELWGDDLVRWTFGPLFNFTVTDRIQAALLVQMNTGVNYTDSTKEYEYYQDRRVTDADKNYIKFYRAAVNVTMKLK